MKIEIENWSEKNLTDNINSTKKYLIRHNYSFISGDVSSPLTTLLFYDNNWKYLGESPINESNFTHIITPKEGTTRAKIRLGRYGSSHTSSYIYRDIMLIEYQDGMENWDIPYFEGMKSVQMPVLTTTGKNLFDANKVIENMYVNNKGEILPTPNFNISDYIEIIPNTTYSFTRICSNIYEFDENKNFVKEHYTSGVSNITTTSNGKYVIIRNYKNPSESNITTEIFKNQMQFEQGEQLTSYEPYKSNILTVNDDVKLRGCVYVNGELKEDILDLISGEYSISVGETVLNGSENWEVWYHTDTLLRFSFNYTNMSDSTNIKLQCDNFPSYGYNLDAEGIFGNYGKICLIIDNSNNKLLGNTVNDLKTYLSQNPITVQYPLKEKSIKTVDLTVVDQDNQPTQLGTFENITHVSLGAENIIPTLEMEVATRISTELASVGPLMDDISVKQQQLNTTVDEQSENVDATMIATTEIFEETL